MTSVLVRRPERQDTGTTERPQPTATRGRVLVGIWRRVVRGRSSKRDRRLDIQGLRAVCMIQVLGFHAWRIGSPIGVDAFIMISAYLMTGAFVRRAEAGRTPWVIER